MNKNLKDILGGNTLPDELVEQLEEAFAAKVKEAAEESENKLREEFANRYEHDKSNLVEAMDRMLTDVVKTYESGKMTEMKKLASDRARFQSAIKEAKKYHAQQLDEQSANLKRTGATKIAEEIKTLRETKRKVKEDLAKLEESYSSIKEEMAKSLAERIKKIDEFVVRQVRKELVEFNQDHRALIETRIKLVTEGKKKIKETQQRFVKEAAKKAEAVINESLTKEMTQLHEDLERNRQNMFGRRIFEAVAAEYMTSYLAEGSELKKVQKVIESKDKQLKALKTRLDETEKSISKSQRKAKLAEDSALRTKVLGELLSNLRGEKRSVMESMLATTKTENLRPTFDRLLPVVLSETGIRKTNSKVLTETANKPAARNSRVVTGNRDTRLMESEQTTDDQELAQVVRLAGIHK